MGRGNRSFKVGELYKYICQIEGKNKGVKSIEIKF